MNVNEAFEQMEMEQLLLSEPEEGEEYCTLESDVTRQIIVPDKYINIGVESDEKANRIRFKFPRFVNDVDLSLLNLRVNYRNGNGEVDQNVTENKSVTSDGYVTFDWRPTRKVTKYKGEIHFIVCALKADSDGTLTNEWNTTLAKSECLEGLEPEQITDEDKEQISDYMLELLSIIDTTKQSFMDATKKQTEAVLQEIQDYGDAVKESIPQDYTSLDSLVRDIDRTRSNGISETSTGETIEIAGSENKLFRNIKLFGKGTQGAEGINLFDLNAYVNLFGSQYVTMLNYEKGEFTKTLKSGEVAGEATLGQVCPEMQAGKTYYVYGADNNTNKFINIGDTQWSYGKPLTPTEEDLSKQFILLMTSWNPVEDISSGTYYGIIITESAIQPEYEVYTGGEPLHTPSPENPLPIKGTGNYNEDLQKYEVPINTIGNQLVDFNEEYEPYGNDGAYTTIAANFNGKRIYIPPAFIGKQLTFSAYLQKTEGIDKVYLIANINGDNISFRSEQVSSNDLTFVSVTFTPETQNDYVVVSYGTGGANNMTVKNPMLNVGAEAIPYGPYTAQQALPAFDEPLYGIPVESGGNYTDASGQQWISDVVELLTKTLTRYCKIITYNGSDDVSWNLYQNNNATYSFYTTLPAKTSNTNALCNILQFKRNSLLDDEHFRFGEDGNNTNIIVYVRKSLISSFDVQSFKTWLKSNPIVVLYPLATPTTTPLTPDQISELQKLQTYYPNTNIFTNTNPQAGLEVEYNADIKMYVNDLVKQSVTELLNIN